MEENTINITKNKQTEETLKKMVEKAFNGQEIVDYRELTEGCCNTAYKIKITNGNETILKIAPNANVEMMSCEKEMMKTEVLAMMLVNQKKLAKVAKVYDYDDSCTICSSEYFFMEVIEGDSFYSIRDNMNEEERASIRKQIGETLHKIHSVKKSRYGHFCINELQYDKWYDAFFAMVLGICEDGKRAGVDVCVSYDEILNKLTCEKSIFDEVKEASLIHFDSWDGNVFVKDGKISGLIDWERAMWADPLMEDQFRKHEISNNFLQGYGITSFTDNEKRRCLWYDVYLYLIMMCEGTYRHYENNDEYIWVKSLFLPVWEELNK